MGAHSLVSATIEEYLAVEADSNDDTKYEYYRGIITAMAGGTPEHGKVSINVARSLGNALEQAEQDCDVYSSDVKIHAERADCMVFPDASAVCGQPRLSLKDRNALTNPVLVVEVIYRSTVLSDYRVKLDIYQAMPSIQAILYVHTTEVRVDTFQRDDSEGWEQTQYTQLEAEIPLKSLEMSLPVSEIYYRVDVEELM